MSKIEKKIILALEQLRNYYITKKMTWLSMEQLRNYYITKRMRNYYEGWAFGCTLERQLNKQKAWTMTYIIYEQDDNNIEV